MIPSSLFASLSIPSGQQVSGVAVLPAGVGDLVVAVPACNSGAIFAEASQVGTASGFKRIAAGVLDCVAQPAGNSLWRFAPPAVYVRFATAAVQVSARTFDVFV